MSTAIADSSETLVALLRTELGLADQVALISPAEAAAANVRLGLFLYSMTPVAEMRNDPEIVVDATRTVPPPLPVDLYYLITAYPLRADLVPLNDRNLDAHALLGAAIRALHDNAILTGSRLRGALSRSDELRISFQPITVEDLTRIWSVFPNTAFQPSVSYLVTPVRIASAIETVTQRVVERRTDFDQMARRPGGSAA
jgi:hypothetical protein